MQVCILQLSTSNAMGQVCIMQVCITQLLTSNAKKKPEPCSQWNVLGKIHSIHPCGPRVGLGWHVVTSDYLIITCTFPLLRGKFNHRIPYSGAVIEISLTEAVSGCG